MTPDQVVFILVSAFTLVMGIIVVTGRNLFHAALAMMASFLGVAGLYVTLDAGFLAAAQLLVYIGAISILIIFAIMMTRRLMQTTELPFNSQWGLGLITAGAALILLVAVTVQFWPVAPNADQFLAARTPVSESILRNSVAELGRTLVSADGYVIPFEVASVLLLAALIGSVIIAWPPSEDEV